MADSDVLSGGRSEGGAAYAFQSQVTWEWDEGEFGVSGVCGEEMKGMAGSVCEDC